MPDIRQHLKQEMNKLPVTLCKLAGGVMAVIAFTGLFILYFRTPDPALVNTGVCLAAGIAGILLFWLAPIIFKNRRPAGGSVTAEGDKWKISAVAWLFLVAVIVLLIIFSYVMSAQAAQVAYPVFHIQAISPERLWACAGSKKSCPGEK